jgi:hypothetical protein
MHNEENIEDDRFLPLAISNMATRQRALLKKVESGLKKTDIALISQHQVQQDSIKKCTQTKTLYLKCRQCYLKMHEFRGLFATKRKKY